MSLVASRGASRRAAIDLIKRRQARITAQAWFNIHVWDFTEFIVIIKALTGIRPSMHLSEHGTANCASFTPLTLSVNTIAVHRADLTFRLGQHFNNQLGSRGKKGFLCTTKESFFKNIWMGKSLLIRDTSRIVIMMKDYIASKTLDLVLSHCSRMFRNLSDCSACSNIFFPLTH